MAPMTILDAARAVRAASQGEEGLDVVERIDIDGVQALTLKGGVIVVLGANELSDWFDYNLDFIPDAESEHVGFSVIPGDSGARWHAGFLEHARYVYTFAKPQHPKLILGHSLGAASAQIVGASLGVPAIGFGSPRPLRQRRPFRGEGWVVNVCRSDDAICYLPPDFLGFRHVGSVYWLTPPDINPGEDHSMDHYISAIEAGVSDTLPETWPPTA